MAGGFSFCGTDIANIGLEYAPEMEDTYVYKTARPRIHEETFDGHDGGYYYGMSREPKEFILRCYFEEKEIDRGIMAQLYHLFREGKSGRLVFDRRPWCYYYATVTDLDISGLTNYLNGVVKITMKAYYPFARSDTMTASRKDKDFYRIMENTAFLESEEMVPPVQFCKDSPITSQTEFILFNPGSEYAPVGIEIAGDVGRGVVITNHTTNQVCKFVAITEEDFSGDELNFVYLDGLNGKSTAVKNGFSTLSFLYHDEGFIQLAPAFPARRNVYCSTPEDTTSTIMVFNRLYDRHSGETREYAESLLKGQYIWMGGAWHEITGVGHNYENADIYDQKNGRYKNEHELLIADTIEPELVETATIATMNKISIEPISTMKLTRLKFVYKPTFA